MTSNKFFKSLLALSLSSALILAGCGGGIPAQNSGQPDENDSSETEAEKDTAEEAATLDDELTRLEWECFVATPWADPKFFAKHDLVDGYIYFQEDEDGDVELLLARKIKHIDFLQLANEMYVVSEEDELLKVNKRNGSYEVIYTAEFGSIDNLTYNEEKTVLLFNDGNYIMWMNTTDGSYETLVVSDNGVSNIAPGDFATDVSDIFEGFYYCKDCGKNDKTIIWRDNDNKTYWYHSDTGENEEIKWEEIFVGVPGV